MGTFDKQTDSFKRAYNELRANSILLCHSEDGQAEVWETGTQLLTIVLLDKGEFWTKTRLELGDEKYEECKKALLGLKGA